MTEYRYVTYSIKVLHFALSDMPSSTSSVMLWGLFLCTLLVATTTVSSNSLFENSEVAKDDNSDLR